MRIVSQEQVSSDCIKIAVEGGPAFFIRASYLQSIPPDAICAGAEFSGGSEDEILDAGLCYAAEHKALSYLERAEQSRFGLERKLLAKGMEKRCVVRALDWLEKTGLLSDKRFARSWLASRKVNHIEGRKKLSALLSKRGINREISDAALDDFFAENDEATLCVLALEKCLGRGLNNEEKLFCELLRRGFSSKLIKSALEEISSQ